MEHLPAVWPWEACTLCRAGRRGVRTLRQAQRREVQWREPNIGLVYPLEDPVIYTSVDDAWTSMMQFMRMSSRKCGRYHNSHRPHPLGSESSQHTKRYHSPCFMSAVIHNGVTHPASICLNPVRGGVYSISAAKWTNERAPVTTHVVRVEPGQAINLTLST